MTGPTEASQARAWLRERGEPVGERGKLTEDQMDRWHQSQEPPAGDDTIVVAAAEPPAAGGQERPARTAETQPRAVTRARQPVAARVRSLFGGQATGKGKKKTTTRRRTTATHPWVRTDRFIGSMWSQLAWSARPIPPLQKILAAQAPMAGVVLQDAARDTLVDRVLLQPAARRADSLEAANAMLGPPVWVMMITAFGGVQMVPTAAGPRPVIGADGGPVWDDRTRPMIAGLRFSLMSWLAIGERSAEEIKSTAEELTRRGNEADDLIRWIFTPTVPTASPADVEAEARARGMAFATPREGQADEDAPEMPTSALVPVPAMGSFAGFDAMADAAARGEQL